MSDDNAKQNPGTHDIQSELADSRMRIDHTLELLEDRFRPSAIVDQAWGYARAKNDDGTATRLKETLVNNPLPVVLMGAGLAWMLFAGSEGSVPRSDSPLTAGKTADPRSPDSTTNHDSTSESARRPASTHSDTSTGRTSTHAGTAAGTATSNTPAAETRPASTSDETSKPHTHSDSKTTVDSQTSAASHGSEDSAAHKPGSSDR